MAFKSCSKCGDHFYERLVTVSVCHQCSNHEWHDAESEIDVEEVELSAIDQNSGTQMGPRFTGQDYEVVRRAIGSLSPQSQQIVVMRFWYHYDIESIAQALKVKNKTIETCLSETLQLLKNLCLVEPGFSRASPRTKIAA